MLNSVLHKAESRGDANIIGRELKSCDGFGIRDVDSLTVKATTDAEILLMEIPMK